MLYNVLVENFLTEALSIYITYNLYFKSYIDCTQNHLIPKTMHALSTVTHIKCLIMIVLKGTIGENTCMKYMIIPL